MDWWVAVAVFNLSCLAWACMALIVVIAIVRGRLDDHLDAMSDRRLALALGGWLVLATGCAVVTGLVV